MVATRLESIPPENTDNHGFEAVFVDVVAGAVTEPGKASATSSRSCRLFI